jgi:predicted RNA binding protein YcfA (HicA-like mRNA interferase family)
VGHVDDDEQPLKSDSVRLRRNGRYSKNISQGYSGAGTVSFRDLQRLLITLGFRLDRISGSHHIYLHPDVSRPINIQPAGKDAKPYQIRQLRDMIREFGLKLED